MSKFYAGSGAISRAPIAGGVEITEAEYQVALAGILAGQIVTVEGGALVVCNPPEPEPETIPEPTAAEMAARRVAEIDARLTAIDIASVRALRAAVAGTATEADRDQLAVLEAEAAALRSERAGLTAVSPVEEAES